MTTCHAAANVNNSKLASESNIINIMAGRAYPSSEARPKRAGEDFARSHDNTSKKPRFDYRNPSTLAADAPEEDAVLDADVIGKSGPQTKRNAVNIDGYESDSDDDNFNQRAAERAKNNEGPAKGQASKDEDEDDMFADVDEDMQGTRDGEEDEELGREGKARKKDVRFLNPEEIEGQVMNSKSGGRVSADLQQDGKQAERVDDSDSDSSSGDDERRDMLPEELDDEEAREVGAGGKRKHAPRLDAFNLQDEEAEGRFDESGNYVRKAGDADAQNDNWLEGWGKKDFKKAKKAQEKMNEENRKKAMAEDALLTTDLLSTLLTHLETGETIFECMARLRPNKPKEKQVPKWKQKRLQNRMDLDEPSKDKKPDPVDAERKRAVEAVTDASGTLYSRGMRDLYDATRELLLRWYKSEAGEDWQAPAPANAAVGDNAERDAQGEMWVYKWSDGRDGEEEHGPYDAPMMKAWNDAGFFGESVEFKKVGEKAWSRLLDVK